MQVVYTLVRVVLALMLAFVGSLLWMGPAGVRLHRQQLYVHAASRGTMPVLRALGTLGADPNSAMTGGHPLYYAAWHGQEEAARYLVAAGAVVDAVDPSGLTPLMAAASRGHDRIVALLLANKARVKAAASCGNALDLALANHHPSAAELLTAAGAVPSRSR